MITQSGTKLLSYENTLLFLMVAFVIPESNRHRSTAGCHLHKSEVSGLSQEGDIVIGGIFNVHTDTLYQQITFTQRPEPITCQRLGLPNYQWLQAMVFAIEEINRNPDLLPNITLGFRIYDSCLISQRSLDGTFWALTGPGQTVPNYRCRENRALAGMVGDAGSSCSIAMARILGLYRLPQLLRYVKKVNFHNKVGEEIFFDQNGDIPAQYDIVNWQLDPAGNVKYVRVGSYDSRAYQGQVFLINTTAIQWSAGQSQIPASVCSPSCSPGFRKIAIEGKPACCFLCVQCPQGEISNQTDSVACYECSWDSWPNEKKDSCTPKMMEFLSFKEALGAVLAAICILCSLFTVAILGLFIYYRKTPIVKANNQSLSFLLLISLALCFLCSLVFIGYPTPETCLFRQAAFGITFAFCVSCILAKTMMVVIAFNATKPNSDFRRWVGPRLSYISISICTSIQVLLCASWLSLSRPFSEYNLHSQPGKIIVECNEGSPIAFWCMLGYLGILATISFIVAFLARKLPDSFNEAQFITFSMLAFLSVWLSFIPAYLSTRGKYMVAMEIFAILSSTFSLVSCIFLPKCYIILLRPENNSKEYLMGRKKAL